MVFRLRRVPAALHDDKKFLHFEKSHANWENVLTDQDESSAASPVWYNERVRGQTDHLSQNEKRKKMKVFIHFWNEKNYIL